MRKSIAVYVSMALIALTGANAGASLLFYDGFDYTPPGTLLAPLNDTPTTPNPGLLNVAYGWNWRYAGAGGAANQAPGIASGGLNYTDVGAAGYSGLQSTIGNSVLFDMTQLGSARVQVTPAAISSGTVYYSGLLQVNSIGTLTAAGAGILLGGFTTATGPGTAPPGTVGGVLRIRTDASDPAVYHIGVGMNSGNATGAGGPNVQFDTAPHTAGQTVFVVASYEFVAGANNDIARMWINPDPADFALASPPSATLTAAPGVAVADSSANLISFNLRNVNTVGLPTGVLFDELRVGTSWADVMPAAIPEPAAAGLIGLGLLVASGWHRLRRH